GHASRAHQSRRGNFSRSRRQCLLGYSRSSDERSRRANGGTLSAVGRQMSPDNASLLIRNGRVIDPGRVNGPADVLVQDGKIAAITKGSEGKELAEYGDLRSAGCVAVSDDGKPVMNSMVMRRALEYARAFDLPVVDHCECTHLSNGGVAHEGLVATELGLQGI